MGQRAAKSEGLGRGMSRLSTLAPAISATSARELVSCFVSIQRVQFLIQTNSATRERPLKRVLEFGRAARPSARERPERRENLANVPISQVSQFSNRVDGPLTLGKSHLCFLLGVLALEEEEVHGGGDESHGDEPTACVERGQQLKNAGEGSGRTGGLRGPKGSEERRPCGLEGGARSVEHLREECWGHGRTDVGGDDTSKVSDSEEQVR